MDWSQTESIHVLIYRVLLAVIALELIRTLMTHELQSVLELLAFVVARKTLKPDLSVYDIFLSVVAFAILLVCRRYLFLPAPAPAAVPLAVGESPSASGNPPGPRR